MKALIPDFRLLRAGRVILAFFSAQAASQLFALVSGLLVVRLLSVEDYAVYALIGVCIGAAAVTSDLGVSSATITLLSRAKGLENFLAIQAGVTTLRLLLVTASTAFLVLIFSHNSTVSQSLGIGEMWFFLLLMAAIFILQASATLARSILASQSKLDVINRVDPLVGMLRTAILGVVFLTTGTCSLAVPVFAWLISAGILSYWLNRNIPRVRLWPLSKPPEALLPMLWPLLPGHIYYLVSGLVPVMVLGARAGPETLAAYWALSRLGLIFQSLRPLLDYIAHPYVSRGHDRGFFRRSMLVISVTLIGVLIIVTSSYIFSTTFLLLLGSKYSHLGQYVWIAVGVASARLLVDAAYKMCIASGETGRQYLAVAAGIFAQLVVYYFTPMRELGDIYLFVSASTLAELFVYSALYLRSARILKRRVSGMPEIAQISPNFPPVVCGVGDYAAKLAASFNSLGSPIVNIVANAHSIRGGERSLGGARSSKELCRVLNETGVRSVIVHFSGYGYARRGLCWWLLRGLRQWKQSHPEGRIVTIFHEVYAIGPIWRTSFWTSYPQRRIARGLVLITDRCFVTSAIGAAQLRSVEPSCFCNILAVFSNVGEPAIVASFDERPSDAVIFGGRRQRTLVYEALKRNEAHFGAFFSALNVQKLLDIGPNTQCPGQIANCSVEALGVLSADRVSQALLDCRLGLLHYPSDRLTKSGIAAAYYSHGLCVVNTNLRSSSDHTGDLPPHITGYATSDNIGVNARAIASAGHVWYNAHNVATVAQILLEAAELG